MPVRFETGTVEDTLPEKKPGIRQGHTMKVSLMRLRWRKKKKWQNMCG